MSSRGRRTMLLAAAAAAVLVVASRPLSWPFLLEQWDLARLGSTDAATRERALALLVARKSERAVGRLVELIGASLKEPQVWASVDEVTLCEEGLDEERTPWRQMYGAALPFLTGPEAVWALLERSSAGSRARGEGAA